MHGPRLRVHHEDARPYLRYTDERYDMICLDTYRQPYIPFYLTAREFFGLATTGWRRAAWCSSTLGHPDGEDDLEKVLSATMGAVFRLVARDPIEERHDPRRVRRGDSGWRLRSALGSLLPELRPSAREGAARIEGALPGGTVYTDDKAPVEWLVDESIVDYAAGD